MNRDDREHHGRERDRRETDLGHDPDAAGAWDPRLLDAARDYRTPPPAPRDRMWERIAAARIADGRAPVRFARRPWWRRRAVLWPAVAAAALAAGILIGRGLPDGDSGGPGPDDVADTGGGRPGTTEMASAGTDVSPGEDTGRQGGAQDPTGTAPDPASRRDATIYEHAAVPVLSRTETLLLQMRTAEAGGERPVLFSERATALLAETRMLLYSPASEEPELRRLLEDLELALARVVRVAAEESVSEREALEVGLERKAILPRLRDQLAQTSPRGGL